MPLPDIRRIVTGHCLTGKAIDLQNDGLPPVTRSSAQPGLAFHEIWDTNEMPMQIGFNEPESTDWRRDPAPPENGTIIPIVDLPPDGPDGPTFDKSQAKAVFDAVGQGNNTEHTTAGRHPLMHHTRSIDYGYVISGKVSLLLDEDAVDPVDALRATFPESPSAINYAPHPEIMKLFGQAQPLSFAHGPAAGLHPDANPTALSHAALYHGETR